DPLRGAALAHPGRARRPHRLRLRDGGHRALQKSGGGRGEDVVRVELVVFVVLVLRLVVLVERLVLLIVVVRFLVRFVLLGRRRRQRRGRIQRQLVDDPAVRPRRGSASPRPTSSPSPPRRTRPSRSRR